MVVFGLDGKTMTGLDLQAQMIINNLNTHTQTYAHTHTHTHAHIATTFHAAALAARARARAGRRDPHALPMGSISSSS